MARRHRDLTPAWGRTAGYRVVDGVRRPVREVVVRHGRVVANRPRLSQGRRIRGLLLVGRGDGARRLARLRVGSRLEVRWRLEGRPPVAIGGSEVLLAGGVRQATDDVELHPRTAIGIDRDTGQLLLLVVDGRQEVSRGLTLVELADLLASLGVEDALNLDGGGSSTLVARDADGVLRVLNAPSDGVPRKVADGLAVFSAG
ncbi:MAG: phosphodiester glycosidase family protein [Nocardioides sp.]